MLNGVWNDLNHAGRSLAKARAFSFVCVVSLGIGMAPVIAIPYLSRIFTLPPQGVNTEGLVEVLTTRVGSRAATDNWSYPDYADLRDANTGMALVGWTYGESELEKGSARALFVSTNYFQVIGVTLVRGPGFSATDEPAVILDYKYWQNHFASDPNIIGKTLTLDDVPHVVVGIAPDRFDGHTAFNGGVNVFLPLERHPRFRSAGTDRSNEWVLIHGRLMPGVGVAQASAAVASVTSALAEQYPSTNENRAGIAAPYSTLGVLAGSQVLVLQTVALTLTGMVLLVVCLNISGMVQVRSAMRERELSIRQAIGATRRQLIQYLLSEALIVAALGATFAALVLFNLPSILPLLTDDPIPPQIYDALKVNLPTVGMCVGLCLLTTLACGLLPAGRFSRPVIISALKDDAGVGGQRAGRVHRVTAALQVAIAVPLIVMSGISLDRFRSTATSDLGFAAELLYAVPLKIDGAKIANADFRIRSVRDNLANATGVAAATLADRLPLDFRDHITPTALQPESNIAPTFIQVHVTRVHNAYLNTMGIPLLRGRGFSADDRAGTEPVTVISKALAEQLLPNADAGQAIGKRLIFGNDEKTAQTLTIVGVSGDFPTAQMSSQREQLLLPLAQQPSQNVFLIARSTPGESPQKMIATLENAARDFDPENRGFGTSDGVAYPTVVTGVWLRKHSMDDFLTQSAVAATAGGVILTLSALGIYGVVGLMVATRTRELAVRVALGASRRGVLGMVLFDVVKLVLPGVVVGVILTAALIRLNGENMGIPLSNVENVSYVAGVAVAVLIAVVASLAPARRAASVEPIVALRSE
jgi:putative ABC transport system permease protein